MLTRGEASPPVGLHGFFLVLFQLEIDATLFQPGKPLNEYLAVQVINLVLDANGE